MKKNSITKESLIAFIEANFDELQAGGCARYDLSYIGTDFNSDRVFMEDEDIYACETAISRLLTRHHKRTKNVRQIIENEIEKNKTSEDEEVVIDLRKE